MGTVRYNGAINSMQGKSHQRERTAAIRSVNRCKVCTAFYRSWRVPEGESDAYLDIAKLVAKAMWEQLRNLMMLGY